MGDERKERRTDEETRSAPAEPAKVHGDPLDDLIPRDLRPIEEPEDDGSREARRDEGAERA